MVWVLASVGAGDATSDTPNRPTARAIAAPEISRTRTLVRWAANFLAIRAHLVMWTSQALHRRPFRCAWDQSPMCLRAMCANAQTLAQGSPGSNGGPKDRRFSMRTVAIIALFTATLVSVAPALSQTRAPY